MIIIQILICGQIFFQKISAPNKSFFLSGIRGGPKKKNKKKQLQTKKPSHIISIYVLYRPITAGRTELWLAPAGSGKHHLLFWNSGRHGYQRLRVEHMGSSWWRKQTLRVSAGNKGLFPVKSNADVISRSAQTETHARTVVENTQHNFILVFIYGFIS